MGSHILLAPHRFPPTGMQFGGKWHLEISIVYSDTWLSPGGKLGGFLTLHLTLHERLIEVRANFGVNAKGLPVCSFPEAIGVESLC